MCSTSIERLQVGGLSIHGGICSQISQRYQKLQIIKLVIFPFLPQRDWSCTSFRFRGLCEAHRGSMWLSIASVGLRMAERGEKFPDMCFIQSSKLLIWQNVTFLPILRPLEAVGKHVLPLQPIESPVKGTGAQLKRWSWVWLHTNPRDLCWARSANEKSMDKQAPPVLHLWIWEEVEFKCVPIDSIEMSVRWLIKMRQRGCKHKNERLH